jgi:hypothetical protein
MQGQCEHPLGHSSCATARSDHDGDASRGGRLEIDVVDADTGAREDAEPRGASKKRGIHDGIGPYDGADSAGNVLFAWIGDEQDFIAEDTSDQRRIDGTKCHNHRTVDGHDLTRLPWLVRPCCRRMWQPELLGLAATCRARSRRRRRR